LIFSSCQSDIVFDDIIDFDSPFVMIETRKDSISGLSNLKTDTIAVNSEKWLKLIDFTKDNVDGWSSSPASYISDIMITQGEFRLLFWKSKDAVVIGYVDKNGKGQQYRKIIRKGELNFLIK
jgi:hypothetical protein